MQNEPAALADETLLELTEADKFVLQWLEENAPLMQDENGVNLGRIRENLKMTPLERLRKADQATAAIWYVRQFAPHRTTRAEETRGCYAAVNQTAEPTE